MAKQTLAGLKAQIKQHEEYAAFQDQMINALKNEVARQATVIKQAEAINKAFKEQNDWLRATLDDYQKAFRSGPKTDKAVIDV